MDHIEFRINKNERLFIDGINFCKSIIIRPFINGIDIIFNDFENDALMLFSEWKRCSEKPGDYLLFTSLIGIADSGGWSLCSVHHQEESVLIKIPYEDEIFSYTFNKMKVQQALIELEKNIYLILSKNSDFHLEPQYVTFPE